MKARVPGQGINGAHTKTLLPTTAAPRLVLGSYTLHREEGADAAGRRLEETLVVRSDKVDPYRYGVAGLKAQHGGQVRRGREMYVRICYSCRVMIQVATISRIKSLTTSWFILQCVPHKSRDHLLLITH